MFRRKTRLLTAALLACMTLLPGVSTHAQDDTWRDPQSLARRLLGYTDQIAIPEPSPAYRPGDTEQFWVTKAGEDTPTRITAHLAAATPTIYLWVEDGIASTTGQMQQVASQLEAILFTLRQRDIYGQPTAFPGLGQISGDPTNLLPMPDVDNDPHLYILYASNLRDNQPVIHNPNNSQPLEFVPGGYSNQHEMLIVNTSAFPDTPLADNAYLGALARAYYRMLADYNTPQQAPWLKEALAWYVLLQLQQRTLSPDEVNPFLDAPNTPLNRLPTASSANAALAAQQLFLGYTIQRYGAGTFSDLYLQPGDGLSAFDAVLARHGATDLVTGAPVTARDEFADFVMANALNAYMGDGRYLHTSVQLDRQQHAAAVPLQDQFNLDLPGLDVSQFGTRYLWLQTTTPRSFGLLFNGQPSALRLPFPADSAPDNHFYWSGQGLNEDTTLTRSFDLTGVTSATLTFDIWYALAQDWNYGYVEVSSDNGATWTILQTELSTTTNPNGLAYGPAYTGVSNPEGPRPFPYLGVLFDTDGMTVKEIVADGPLAGLDIQAGDRVIGHDKQEWPNGQPDIIGYLSNFAPGDTVHLYVERGSERFDLPVVLGVHPTRVFPSLPLWETQHADLTPYAGQQIMVRFEYVSLPDRENYGMAVDNIAVPEIGFRDGAESGVPGWTLNGWQQMDNRVEQRFLLQVATTPTSTSPGSVRQLIGPSDSSASGSWTFNLNPGEVFIIAISGLNDNTDSPAGFDLYLRDITPTPEPTAPPEPAATPNA